MISLKVLTGTLLQTVGLRMKKAEVISKSPGDRKKNLRINDVTKINFPIKKRRVKRILKHRNLICSESMRNR